MKGKRLRMRAARLLAAVYVMYVVMSGMAIPGTDGSIKPLFWTKAAVNTNYVDVANNEVLKTAKVGTVIATNASEGTRITMFTPQKSFDSPYQDSKYKYNIYSVRYNGKDYFYDPTNKGDGTKEGLFYSDSSDKWGFAFPQSDPGPYKIEVQIAVELIASQKNVNILNQSFSPSAQVGEYEQISSDVLGTSLGVLRLEYYDYEGAFKRITCSSGADFSTSNLRFYCLTREDKHYTYYVQYGGSKFPYNGDVNTPAVLSLWTTETGTASAYRQAGTNQLVVDTNIPDAETYIQLTAHRSPTGNLSGKYAANLTYNKSDGSFTGTKLTFPEEGFYIPGDTQSSGYSYYGTGRVSVGNKIQGVDITNPPIKWKGPKTSTLGTIEEGDTKNITDNLKDVSNTASDFAGNVVKVGTTVVTEESPYSDEYVTIDYYGNVTAKKASGSSKSYTLTTETKYTKMTYKDSGNYEFIGYEDASGNFSYTPTGVYGTQNWSVKLTVTTTASSVTTETPTTEPTTTEPTTAAPVTYKATLSTNNSKTKIASGDKSVTGNGSISLEAGQTVTVTPGTSTYGSTVTVSDSATRVTKNSNGTYTFTMPAKNVTVTVQDITLSSISATITGTGGSSSSIDAFGVKTSAPTNAEILNAVKSKLNITAKLSDNSTRSITSSEAVCTVAKNTLGNGTANETGDTITYPGIADITVVYGGKSTTVSYYYSYLAANQEVLDSITIAAKADSTLSTDRNSPTVYGAENELPSEAVVKNQIGALTAFYTDSLGNKRPKTIESTAEGVERKVTLKKTNSISGGVYKHLYEAQVTATYDGKTSNTVTFYYCYETYSVTCETKDNNGKDISASLKATVSPMTDIAKGTTVTITTPEDKSLTYLMTKITVTGTSKKDYSNTVSNHTFAMPDEPVVVTVTYTKLSGYTVTPPTVTKLSAAPTQATIRSLLNGAYLIPEYQSSKGSKIDLTNGMVTVELGSATETFKDGVSTYNVPVTIIFKEIEKKNAFFFTYEEKHSYTASVIQTTGPNVQVKKDGSYASSVSGYYGDTMTVKVPEETQGYAFPTVTVKSASGDIIKKITKPGEESFAMPAQNVTITAGYQKLTELKIIPPDTSDGNYDKNTTKADLPLGTITAVYGSTSQTKTITMTHNMYTIGAPEETTTENADGSKTVTTTVPVTIHVEYGGLKQDETFSYSYSYNVSKNSKTIRIGAVTCGNEILDNQELVKVGQSVADPDEEVRIAVKEVPEYAFPTISVKTASRTETLTLSGMGDEKMATFTMPNEDVEILADYKPLTSISLTEPNKKEYDHYANPDDLDLTGGSLTAVYGGSLDNKKTISLQTEAGVSNGCIFNCTKGTATEENGIRVVPVTVSIVYGEKTVSYQYTYEELRSYSVTLDESTLPEDFTNKGNVRLSTTIGNYNDELTLFLPADTDDMYAFPIVTLKRGDEVETWEPQNGVYKTMITDDMVVSVAYCKLNRIALILPEDEEEIKTSLTPIDMLDTGKVKLELVYNNDKGQEGGRKPISSTYASFAYGEETESVIDGAYICKVPVLVTANYKNLVKAEGSYSFRYCCDYVVSVKDEDGNSLPVDKNRANAGDEITISLTPGRDIRDITANGISIVYTSSDDTAAVVKLTDDMKSDKEGYVLVVVYQKVQRVKAPKNAVVVSDSIMTEQELAQKLADLSTFDFGEAIILVSYNSTIEPNQSIELNSPSIAKELLADRTTEKVSADGTYIERTYVIKATINGKSVEVPIIVKVEKKKADGDGSGDGTGQLGEKNPGTGAGTSTTEDVERPVTTDLKPGKVTGVKVSAKKRKLTVTWKAADNATAYEIWISTKKNGGYLKAATVKKSGGKKTYSYTVKKLDGSKLKKGKTYYVKVRAVNVKSKLTKKTMNQTVKSKRNRRLYVTVKSVKNAVSYTVKASTKKKSGYKTIFKFDEIGKKKYTKYIKHQKRNTKYYIRVEVKVETGKRLEGSYSSVAKGKCK